MLRYGYFDSEITGYDEEGMPIFDRAESSDFLAMFISHIISDGVLAQPGDCFQVLAFEGMKLKIRPGFGIVKGRFVFDENDFYLTVPNASANFKRIDRVILRANYPQRLCEIMIIEGEPASNPVPPDLIQPTSGDYYELCLATININSNQTVITQSNITDTRYDSSVCGVVTQAIDHIDTSVLFAQLNQFYNEFVVRSNSSYEKFVADMEAYLKSLNTSGNNQLTEIVAVLQNFETMSEEQFIEWFNQMKDQLSEDAAGNLQLQIDDLHGAVVDLDSIEKSFRKVFFGEDYEESDTDPEAMTPGDISSALSTKWDGETSEDVTAMNSEDVDSAISTPWNGESSEDPEAMSPDDVKEATDVH